MWGKAVVPLSSIVNWVAFFELYLITSFPITIFPKDFHPKVEPTLIFCPVDNDPDIDFLRDVFEAISNVPLIVEGSKIISYISPSSVDPLNTTLSTIADAYSIFGFVSSNSWIKRSPIIDKGSPERTFTFSEYVEIQSEVDALIVESFGLYTSGISSGSLATIELKINLIDLSVPFAL